MDTFDFNIFEFTRVVGRNMQMPTLALALLKKHNLLERVEKQKFVNFISHIYNLYFRSVDYHNDVHASDVTQHVHLMMHQGMAARAHFNELDRLCMIVAALCHDVRHDGFNNRYHVVTKSHLFLKFGAEHVQECFHVDQTLKLMER